MSQIPERRLSPVLGWVILRFSQICEFVFFPFFFVLSTPSSPVGIRNVGIPFRLLFFLPSEGGRGYPLRKGSWSEPLQRGMCHQCYDPEQFLTFQHFNKHSAFRLCLVSQAVLLFFLFLVLLTIFSTDYVQNWLLGLYLFCIFLLVSAIPPEPVV